MVRLQLTLAFWVHANLLGLFSVDMCLCVQEEIDHKDVDSATLKSLRFLWSLSFGS